MPNFDERSLPTGYAIPQWFFGVQVYEEFVYDPWYGPYQALRVVYVYFGSPASYRVEVGDIISRVDGHRVQTYADFYQRVSQSSSGVISLRVRDVRTGYFIDLQNIHLMAYPSGGGGGGPAGPGGPGGPAGPGGPGGP